MKKIKPVICYAIVQKSNYKINVMDIFDTKEVEYNPAKEILVPVEIVIKK